MNRAGYLARHRNAGPSRLLEVRDRIEKHASVGMERLTKELPGGGPLDEATEIHHPNIGRDVVDDREVVADEEIGWPWRGSRRRGIVGRDMQSIRWKPALRSADSRYRLMGSVGRAPGGSTAIRATDSDPLLARPPPDQGLALPGYSMNDLFRGASDTVGHQRLVLGVLSHQVPRSHPVVGPLELLLAVRDGLDVTQPW